MMKIAFISSEVFPFVKTGGLADVSGSLPKEISKLGDELIIILPKYKNIDTNKFNLIPIIEDLKIPVFVGDARIFETILPDSEIKVYLVGNEEFFNREDLYGDYSDNLERFSFFSLAVLEILKAINWKPDIIHSNDWQTAMVPTYLKTLYDSKKFLQDTKILFSIHNLGYQGIFDASKYPKLGIDEKYFHHKYLEFYGKINLLKGGLIFADCLNTVSVRYSEEIQTPDFGFGLDGVLRQRSDDLYGILNGIDYDIWNPETDKFIWKNYTVETIENKEFNKRELQKSNNLPLIDQPLIGMVTRLASQKGLDLIVESIDILKELDMQLIVIGTGDKKYESQLKKASELYPRKIGVNIDFNAKKSHQIEAGSDIFLMPSKYEPCGLNQMISLKYGTIPVVRETGGLADSIKDVDKYKNGNGFVFSDYSAIELIKTIIRAINVYKTDKERWKKIMTRSMKQDFSFKKSAKTYRNLYDKILTKY
ncbi:MAG: glycogen synthase GlgA [Promethearchaeota archaeon]|nr:MAG: glycogen synthase GlgA [Candidatus Lokiarchaeota archaeon]